jgi:hypothetical protein
MNLENENQARNLLNANFELESFINSNQNADLLDFLSNLDKNLE